jgi:hypothetical protein
VSRANRASHAGSTRRGRLGGVDSEGYFVDERIGCVLSALAERRVGRDLHETNSPYGDAGAGARWLGPLDTVQMRAASGCGVYASPVSTGGRMGIGAENPWQAILTSFVMGAFLQLGIDPKAFDFARAGGGARELDPTEPAQALIREART